jgi:hypothetical protein
VGEAEQAPVGALGDQRVHLVRRVLDPGPDPLGLLLRLPDLVELRIAPVQLAPLGEILRAGRADGDSGALGGDVVRLLGGRHGDGSVGEIR